MSPIKQPCIKRDHSNTVQMPVRNTNEIIQIPVPNINIKGNSQQIHIAAPTIEEILQTVDVTNS